MILARSVLWRFGYESVIAEETPETILKGLKLVGGGECVPTGALLGGIVQTVKEYGLPPRRAAALIPSSLLSCNFPQIPMAVKLGLRKAGLEELQVFATGGTGVARRICPYQPSLLLSGGGQQRAPEVGGKGGRHSGDQSFL